MHIMGKCYCNEIISNMNANVVFLPFGLRKGVLPIFHLDNSAFVFAEDSDVTTHALLLLGFQHNTPNTNFTEEVKLGPLIPSRKLINHNFDTLMPCTKPNQTHFILSETCKNYKPYTKSWLIFKSL